MASRERSWGRVGLRFACFSNYGLAIRANAHLHPRFNKTAENNWKI